MVNRLHDASLASSRTRTAVEFPAIGRCIAAPSRGAAQSAFGDEVLHRHGFARQQESAHAQLHVLVGHRGPRALVQVVGHDVTMKRST